jgi:hypothetical protein
MSKITEIKKQYPELNISIIDLFSKFDGTKTNKYLPLICKLFSHRFQPKKMFGEKDSITEMIHIKDRLMNNYGFNPEGMSDNEMYSYYVFMDHFNSDDIRDFISFRKFNERGLIPNNDVTTYQTFEEIRASVGLASLKDDEKIMKSQVIKEYEDDVWLSLRPLTFGASSKYGAGTKWCTTYQNDKQYFERYWRRGILVYFINKITGLKFAVFKSLDYEKELSFWNSADNRVDFLELDIEDYMIPIVKNILNSNKTNKDLCSVKIQIQVEIECNRSMSKSSRFEELVEPPQVREEEIPQIDFQMEERTVESRVFQLRPQGREIRDEIDSIMEEPIGYGTGMVEENNSLIRRRIQHIRESLGLRIQNIEIEGTHQVGEEDCQG